MIFHERNLKPITSLLRPVFSFLIAGIALMAPVSNSIAGNFPDGNVDAKYSSGSLSQLGANQETGRMTMNMLGFGEDKRTTDSRTVVTAGDIVYAAGGDSGDLVIWDVSNRKQPVLLSVFSSGLESAEDITLKDDIVFAAGKGSDFLSVIDVSNPGGPVLRGRVAHPEISAARGVALHPEQPYLYLAVAGRNGTAAVAVVDISNPAAPLLANRITHPEMTPGNSFHQQGNYLYLSGWGDNSVMIFDASDASRPRMVRRFTDDQLLRPRGITGRDKTLFVNSSGNKSIVAFDISDPVSPVKTGSLFHPFLTGVRMGALAENRLFVASWQGSGIFLIDVSDPSAMHLADSKFHRSLSGAHGIAVDGRYVYATGTITGGIAILEHE